MPAIVPVHGQNRDTCVPISGVRRGREGELADCGCRGWIWLSSRVTASTTRAGGQQYQ
jgi:hypothetical protein